ncbi:hypothetical protein KSD_34260 [Ktedonobacter sp. SOSP1-85]|uniref:WD40 repeat domain-containing serine/threonine protein kinase n=1 Tax=Ktedonobacter sp. SOSP1-85 TaxID=2778367 RepID=UPI001916179F|nr:serine/threonine-protein kinase [Ktedonobacter sp. SOSP1-85]GHO75655.1 hypothetical protein KSD_34260 [Ktedonobacter sp. SOSP1-85]
MAEGNSRVGQRIGDYRLTRLMGEGGFAQVYRGEHIQTQELVAIKLLHTLPGQLDEAQIRKFYKESRIVTSLRHPHIVKVQRFGVDERTPYLIMEFLPYGTLRRRHPEGSILKPTLIYSYLEKIADALDYAHSQGIVHRDVKPENILLNRRGELILSDFGIAFISHHNAEISQLSMPGLAGTYFYMAPEQWMEKPTYASDQYSLALTVYEWLCGERPYRGNPGSLLLQHLNVIPPSPRTRNPMISTAVEEVIMKGLAKDPSQRYATVQEFARAFGEAAGLNITTPASVHHTSLINRQHQEEVASHETQRLSLPQSKQPLSDLARSTKDFEHIKKRVAQNTKAQLANLTRRNVLLGLAGVAFVASAGSIFFFSQHTTPPPAQSKTPTNTPGYVLRTFALDATALALSWSPKGTYLASGCANGTVNVWEAQTGKRITSYHQHTRRVNAVAWSPDERFLASASDDSTIHVWNPLNGKLTQKYAGHSEAVSALSWSPDGQTLASGSADTTIQLWEPISGNLLERYEGHTHGISALAWSPQGAQIASSALYENSVVIWEVASKQTVINHQHSDSVLALSWSPHGNYLASGGKDSQVHVWSIASGEKARVYTGHRGNVYAIAWSSTETAIASGGDDRTIQIWPPFEGDRLYTNILQTTTYGLAWSPTSGTTIASGGDDKHVKIWRAIE